MSKIRTIISKYVSIQLSTKTDIVDNYIIKKNKFI